MTPVPQHAACPLPFRKRRGSAHKDLPAHQAEPGLEVPVGRVPRVARLMALALRFEQLLQAGVVTDYAALSRLGHVSRARITQIMNLRVLAPEIQEAILFWPRTVLGRDPLHVRLLQPLAAVLDWREQRVLWQALQEQMATEHSQKGTSGT